MMPWHTRLLSIVVALLLGAVARSALAVESAPPPPAIPAALPETEDELAVYLVTMGPGDHPFFKFGHNAIWIQDRILGRGLVYNFGTFTFDSPALIPKFLLGRPNYWLSVSTIQATVFGYARENRSVEIQQLDMTPDEKRLLKERLEKNARPENREYQYDYFLDNCSTRVRDALDGALGGLLRRAGAEPGRLTYRNHALRLTADLMIEYLGIDLALGPMADRPIDRWAEAFIPAELQKLVRQARRPGPGGAPRPLVRAEQVLVTADRPPPLAWPPSRGLRLFGAGALAGLLLAGLGALGRRTAWARVPFGLLIAVIGLVLGFLGTFLCIAWAFTNHRVAYANQNVLLLAPWAMALVVYGIGVARRRPRAIRRAFYVAAAAVVAGLVALALKLVPPLAQENGRVIALLLPVWLGMALGLAGLVRGSAGSST